MEREYRLGKCESKGREGRRGAKRMSNGIREKIIKVAVLEHNCSQS